MPDGKGTYGSQVGRPPKNRDSSPKPKLRPKSLIKDIKKNIVSKIDDLKQQLADMGNPPEGGWTLAQTKKRKALNAEIDRLETQGNNLPDTEKKFP